MKFKLYLILAIIYIFYNNILGQEKIYYSATPVGGKLTIYSINPDGTSRKKLFNDNYYRHLPVVSKDGKEMIYIKYKGNAGDSAWICKSTFNGENETIIQLITNVGVNTSSGNIYSLLSWSNDKSKILYGIHYDGWPGPGRDGDVFELNLFTNEVRNLTNDWDYTNQNGLQYTPDNSKIVYVSLETDWYAHPWGIYMMDSDGLNKTKLNLGTHNSYIFHSTKCISDNGKKIIYNAWNNLGESYKMYIATLSGLNNLQFIPSYGNATGLSNGTFSMEDDKIAFVRNDSLFISKADGNILKSIPKGEHSAFDEISWVQISNCYINSYNSNNTVTSSPITVTSPPVTVTGTISGYCPPNYTVMGISLLTEVAYLYPNAHIYLYPIPTTGKINISAHGVLVDRIEIYNSLGELVLSQANTTEVDLSNYPSGIYYIWFNDKSKNKLAGQKIMKE